MKLDTLCKHVADLAGKGTIAERVAAVNALRRAIHDASPFAAHPVDETWARVVARVNGANGGALYVQEWGNINGYRKITKPEGHTWESFAELLLASMPPQMEEHYRNKVLLHIKWWQERGFPDGIPDESPYELEAARKAPSWRRVCKSLLRNDYWGKGLGFSQHKSEAYKQYLDLMKRRREAWGVGEKGLQVPQVGQIPMELAPT